MTRGGSYGGPPLCLYDKLNIKLISIIYFFAFLVLYPL